MSSRFKYYLFAWCAGVSVIMGSIATSLIIRYSDKIYVIGGGVFVAYYIIMVIGVKILASKARKEGQKE